MKTINYYLFDIKNDTAVLYSRVKNFNVPIWWNKVGLIIHEWVNKRPVNPFALKYIGNKTITIE